MPKWTTKKSSIYSWNFYVFISPLLFVAGWGAEPSQVKPLKEPLYSSQCVYTHVLQLHDAVYIEHVGRVVGTRMTHLPLYVCPGSEHVTWSEMSYSRTFPLLPPSCYSFPLKQLSRLILLLEKKWQKQLWTDCDWPPKRVCCWALWQCCSLILCSNSFSVFISVSNDIL